MELARQIHRAARPCTVIILAGVFLLVAAGERTEAHKPVTSKYDYNKDVFPLLRDHCGRCHVEGGAAPMSLMTYKSAVPWAVSIRDEITAGRMPPWPVDPTSPPLKGGHPISSRDVNMIVEWASGGTPEGNTETQLPAVTVKSQWKLGSPDLSISGVEHTVARETMEETRDFSLPVNVTATKWIKAADLLPETMSIVRDAVISIENGPTLALWEPGGDATAAPSGAAFKLAPGSRIHVQVHYKKHFDQEQVAVSDKSTIGLYFTDPPLSGRELQSFTIDAMKGSTGPDAPTSATGKLPAAARIVALRPMLDRAYESVNVEAITSSGTHVPLLHLHGPRPQWLQRYWLQEPVELAGGSQIAVTVTPLSDYSDEPKLTRQTPLQVFLDYVPQ